MTEPESILDLLVKELNPIPEDSVELPVDSQQAQDLYLRVTGTPYAGTPRRRYGRQWLIPGIAALLVMLGFGAEGAFAGLAPSHVADHVTVLCYSGPSLSSGAAAVDAAAGGPIESCAAASAAGQVRFADYQKGETPPLVACIGPGGVTAVFPSDPQSGLCSSLGLKALPPGVYASGAVTTAPPTPATTIPEGNLVAQTLNAIAVQLQHECMSAKDAKATLEALLANARLHWKVVVGPFSPDKPCASPAPDEQDKTLYLVGLPAPGSTPGSSVSQG